MNRLRRTLTTGAPATPLLILFGLNAVDELDRTAFSVLLPTIRDDLGLDNQGIFGVVTLVVFVALASQVLIGYYADRLPRVRMAAIGASIWGLFTLFTGLLPGVALLVVARSMTGIGRAVNEPTHYSLLADYYEPELRPRVYGIHRLANPVGQAMGPLIGGILSSLFGWRVPFLFFWIPTAILVYLAISRLREPVRGGHERRAMQASEELIGTEETPPSFAEAWRICNQVLTLRRIFYSLPFLAASLIGLSALTSVFYNDVFGLNDAQRGIVQAFTEPVQFLGILVGIPVGVRLARRDPGNILRMTAVTAVVVAAAIVGFSRSPNLASAVSCHIVFAAVLGAVGPSITATLSLVIPPRARALGFAMGSLYILAGVPVIYVIGAFADTIGIRDALLVLVPVFGVGAYLIASAGSFAANDIAKVRASTVAQAEVLAARRRGEAKLLLVKSIDVGYDGVQVLFGVDFEVDEGEIIALLGTNGAGKSTLLKSISGLAPASAGAVVFDGVDMTYAPPQEIAARGVVQVPGGKGAFPTLSVEENLKIAGWLYRRDQDHVRQATERVLEYFPVLRERWQQPAGNLSGGEQQMLTLGQAFIAKPRLLMIDELSLGLAPVIVEQLLEIVKAIRDNGTTIILVEQSVNVALTVAETAYFMEKGEIRFHGPTAELLKRPDVLRSVFLQGAGSIASAASGNGARRTRLRAGRLPAKRHASNGEASVVLEARGLSKRFGGVVANNDVSFELREHEILGFIGPNGAGKTTLFDLLSAFVAPSSGRVVLLGHDVTELGPDGRARLGLGRSFQDARLFAALTVRDAIAVALERHVEVRDPIAAAISLPSVADSERRVKERVNELLEVMGLNAFGDKFVSELSTGSRRIVDIACVLAHEPRVILFDEPSSGIAQREAEALGPLLLHIRESTGASLVVIEHDMGLVTAISDRMIALDLGTVVAEGAPRDVVRHPAVIASYLGTDQAVIKRSGRRTSAGSARRARRGRPLSAKRGRV